MQAVQIEKIVATRFGLPQAPTLLADRDAGPPIAFTRLHVQEGTVSRSMAVPPEEALAFQVALKPVSNREIWSDGQQHKVRASSGDTFLLNLSANPMARLSPPFDLMRFYVPAATLDRLTRLRGLRPVGGMRTTCDGVQDPVMLGLAMSLIPALERPEAAPALFIDSIALAFHSHIIHAYGKALESGVETRAGLAPWQCRRALDYIDTHLDGDPSIAKLAAECSLSSSYFARAFRQTTGMPPHRWLLKRRIERAKQLLLEGDLELAQIAVVCGFVDQSHLSRVFTRHEDETPARWRRLRHN